MKSRTLVAVLLLALVLVAMSWAGGTEEAKPKTVRVALNVAPTTVDPFDHRQRVVQLITRNWTDALMQMLPDGSVVLDLAESIRQLDQKSYEIKVRNLSSRTLDLWQYSRIGTDSASIALTDSPVPGTNGSNVAVIWLSR